MTGDQHQENATDDAERQAWIAAAESDVRATAKPFVLVPHDHAVRQWDTGLSILVEKQGSSLARVARAAATQEVEAARLNVNPAGEARAAKWRADVHRVATGDRYGPKSLDRWFTVADMLDQALADWLPDDAVTIEQRQEIANLQETKRSRDESVRGAAERALVEAIAVEKERRQLPDAWEDELDRRREDETQREAAEIARAVEDINRGSLLASLNVPEQFAVLPPYRLDMTGVYFVRITDTGGEVPSRIATAPLLVVRVFIDPAGDQLVELAWRDGANVVTRVVPRSVSKSGRALVKALGNAGIPIVEADSRAVERYLAAVEADNRHVIPREAVARQLGWQPDGAFLSGPDAGRRVEVAYDEQARALASHHVRGTLEEWQTVIKEIEPYPIPRLMLAAAFAAPLLQLLGLASFTIDLSGRSTGGKTVSAMVTLSVWADPSEEGGGIMSWRTTLLAAEKRLNLANGLPVVFDETRAAKEEGLVDKVLYQVPMNHGTSRGGGYPSDLPWRTVLISTGEQPALSFTTHEGASARVMSLRGAPFGRDGAKSATAAKKVKEGVTEQYGTAGAAFVERLIEEFKQPGAEASLRRRHDGLAAQHKGGTDVTRRRAVSIASLRLGAELAYEWGICPLPPLDAEVWTDLLAVEQARDDRGEMALDLVREYVTRQQNRMWTPMAAQLKEPTPIGGWIGAYLSDDGNPMVCLLPALLGEELARRGYVLDAVRQAWQDAKLLTLDNKGDLIRRRFNGNRVRVCEFLRSVFDGPDEDAPEPSKPEPKPVDPDEPCQVCGWPLGSAGHEANCDA